MGRPKKNQRAQKRPLETAQWETWGFKKAAKLEHTAPIAEEASQYIGCGLVNETSPSIAESGDIINTAVATTEPAVSPSYESQPHSRYESLLRSILNGMAAYARSPSYSSAAMSPGFAEILREESPEEILQKLLRGITSETKALLQKERWTYDDILQLPTGQKQHNIQGVYGIFALGHKPKAASYVGSTGNIWRRWGQHRNYIKHTEGIWPAANDYKYHYFRKYFEIKDLQYKILAMFDEPIEDQYLKMLEGIFAILFSAMYCYPDGNVPTNRQAAVNLINNLQFTYNIHSPFWGLNMRWPISQQCPHPMRSMVLPCQNPACGRMTYPPMGKSHPRVLFDENDIKKGFLCGYCQDWKVSHNNQLPSDQRVAIHKAKNDGTHPKDSCEHCGDKAPKRSYSLHSELLVTLCAACRKFYKENKHLPSKEIIKERERRRALRNAK